MELDKNHTFDGDPLLDEVSLKSVLIKADGFKWFLPVYSKDTIH